MPNPIPQEPAYGAVKQQADLRRANPMPKAAPLPLPGPTAAQQAAPPQPQTNMWLIPHKYPTNQAQPKNRAEVKYDVGMLWEALAQQAGDPMTKAIAKTMTGRG